MLIWKNQKAVAVGADYSGLSNSGREIIVLVTMQKELRLRSRDVVAEGCEAKVNLVIGDDQEVHPIQRVTNAWRAQRVVSVCRPSPLPLSQMGEGWSFCGCGTQGGGASRTGHPAGLPWATCILPRWGCRRRTLRVREEGGMNEESGSGVWRGLKREWLAWAYLLTDRGRLLLTLSTNTHVHVSQSERTPVRRSVKGLKADSQ